MADFLVGKYELQDLLLNQHLTIKQAAARLDVSEKTIRKYAGVYAIDARLWWKYQQITCPDCGRLIDPNCELDEKTRKKLIKKGHVVCDTCKESKRKETDRDRKRAERDADREKYNTYQRDLMRKRRAEAKKKKEQGET
jgi:hypothetical protein